MISGGLGPALVSVERATASGPVYTNTATIDLGAPGTVSVAVDPTTNTIFAVDRDYPQDGTLSLVNGATNAVTKVTVGHNPWDVAVDPTTGTAYVADAYDNDVSVVSEASGTVTGTIGVGSGPFGVAVDPDTGTLYVANASDNTVSVVDEATQTVTATVNVGTFPNRLAVDPATDTVYVVNEEGNTVSVIDGATNTVTATLDVGENPQSVAVDSTGLVYVANSESGSVSVISAASNTVTSTLSTPGVSAVGVNTAAGTLLVAGDSLVQGGSSLSVIDEATDNVIASLSPYTQTATAVMANPVTGEIYVAFSGGGGDGFLAVVTPVVAPGAPAGISASPGDGLATLTITPPTDDGGSQIEYYTVTYTDSTNAANSGQVNVYPSNPVTIYNLTDRDSYTFSATATNLAGTGPSSGSSNAVIPVAPLTIGTTSLPGAPLAQNYSQTISTSGGLPPFSYSIISGSLPAGLGLDPDSGVISGTPSGPAGTSSFTVGVNDANSPPASASQQLSIQTGTLPKITISSSRNPAFYGQRGAVTVTVGSNHSGLGVPAGSVVLDLGGGNLTAPVTLTPAGLAKFKLTSLPVGYDSITADYSGDATYLPVTSAQLNQEIDPDNTSVTLTSTVAPSASGQRGNVIATVRDPDTPNYEFNQSDTFTQVVNQASTTTSISSSRNPVQAGASGNLAATVRNISPGAACRPAP